jgi:hypothetical protein
MKKIAIALALVLGVSVSQSAHAEDPQVIAIIDTAIDSAKMPNVIYEACFTTENTGPVINNGTGVKLYDAEGCPNGTTQQEGPGSASASTYSITGIDHGYNVSSVASLSNPNVKIVFIRISSIKKYPTYSMIRNDDLSVDAAINWVSKNASKYGIDAVSISQSRSNFTAGACPVDKVFENAVANLNQQMIPTFVATGNDGKKNMIGFPSCVPGVQAVSALKPDNTFASYSNVGPGLDIVARGDMVIKSLRGSTMTVAGTSIATPSATAKLIAKKGTSTWNTLFASLPKVLGYSYVS